MRKYLILLIALPLFLLLSHSVSAEVIYKEEFNDSSRITTSGNAVSFWSVAPLEGTSSYPSLFTTGGSQSGSIFYGVNSRDSSARMHIDLPNLSYYTNLELSLSLAAPDGTRWESSHRDSYTIWGNSETEEDIIDIFLPKLRGAPLTSQLYDVDLHYYFQDFTYDISPELNELIFGFAATADNEYVGLDTLVITGDPALPLYKEECMDGGWELYGFKNQGDCVSSLMGQKECPDLNGLVIEDEKVHTCPGTILLSAPIIMYDNSELICNGTKFVSVSLDEGVLVYGSNVEIRGCYFEGFGAYGITNAASNNNNKYINNEFVDIGHTAIHLRYTSESLVRGNTITDSRNGIYLSRSDDCEISNNTISSIEQLGILIYHVTSSNIVENVISDIEFDPDRGPLAGIAIFYLNTDNLVARNILKNNSQYNILMRGTGYRDDFPRDNTIIKNDVYVTDIHPLFQEYNIYCVNGVGNNYFDGATGPICP